MKKSLLLNASDKFFKEVRFLMKELSLNTMTATIIFVVMEAAKNLKQK